MKPTGTTKQLSSYARLSTSISRLFNRVQRSPAGPFRTSSDVLDHYVSSMPSAQNAIDSVPGWVGAMPAETGLQAGTATLYADTRIRWLLDQCYSVAGKRVLELGPLEGFHTYMLDRAGAASVDAIEANALAFVRCLITKEVLKLQNSAFYLGDFLKWLEQTDRSYDLVLASGVLYHSHDPVHLLEMIASRANSIFLWTHYFDDTAMPPGDLRRVPFSEAVEIRESHGVRVRLHERSYYKAWRDPSFCGGIQDRHFWIDRADILGLLAAFGFDRILVAHEQPEHINGPSFSVFAERSSAKPGHAEAAAEAPAPEAPEPVAEVHAEEVLAAESQQAETLAAEIPVAEALEAEPHAAEGHSVEGNAADAPTHDAPAPEAPPHDEREAGAPEVG